MTRIHIPNLQPISSYMRDELQAQSDVVQGLNKCN